MKGSEMADARVITRVIPARQHGSADDVATFYATDTSTKAADGRPAVKGGDVLGRPVGYVVPPSERLPIVTEWSGMTDYVNAPPDYGIFHRQYLRYTRMLVARFGVPPSDLDDVVSEIMMRFLERDSIGVFSREWASRSASGRSGFRSYYSRFIVTYAQGKNRNVRKHGNRYPLICDASVDEEGRVTWLDDHAPTESFEDAATSDMDFESLVANLRSRVSPELTEAVDAVLDMAMSDQVVRVASLARRLGCSQRLAKERLESVREALAGLRTA